MIEITRAERDLIAERYQNVHIVRTMKGHRRRGKYYMEEAVPAMKYLAKLRGVKSLKAVRP